jgi:hypothetical protein
MSSKKSWSKTPHFSIGGLEVVPGAGLEVSFDSSPEVLSKSGTETEQSGRLRRYQRINWRRKCFGLPILWVAIGVTAFVVGTATGGIIVSVIASKARSPQGDR